ncbi:uncharacterized protein LOC132593050 isoform X2 [Zootoca vivipara]|uniref:uncharacterized protein LOC132593050 isoform X2 n=1 Tax=Zootoca vivipara TaxID=8524 RepID=UPI00293B90DD|nr:uncharacterized protein LOC132593050 isoform X2 [Zootoca vivipara]
MSSYEIIRKGRKQLIDILQNNIDCVLDELRSEIVITKEEYEGLEKYEDSKKKSRELLILIQAKGEAACCQFLECLEVACPGSNHALHVQKHDETQNPLQISGHSVNYIYFYTQPPLNKHALQVQKNDHLNLRKDLHVPDSVEFSGERSGSNSMDLARSGNQDAPRSREGVGEVESLRSPVSSEAGSGSQSPDDAIMLPWGASSTEDPDDASLLLSSKEREVKTPDSLDVAENPSDAAMGAENGGRDEDLESCASPRVGSGAESLSAPLSSSKGSGASDGNCGKSEGIESGVQIPAISASKGEEEGAQQLDSSKKKRTSGSPTRRERFENSKECLPPVEKPESPRVLGETEEAVPKERIIRDLQPLLDNDSSLSQALGGRPFIAYRQPPNLNQLLTHNNTTTRLNMDTGTRACNEPRCQLCCHIHPDNIITGPNNIQHTISGLFNCSSSNIVYAIKCQQCPSAIYIGQTGQTLRQRINGHKSDIRNHKTEKPVGEHFNLPGHSIQDLKAAVLLQKNFRNRQEREDAKLELITKLKTMEPPGMN